MHLFNKLILLGLPGSGKTTLGKELADQLSLPFYDLDVLIEENSGLKIKDIFSSKGEEAFREIEKKTLIDFLEINDQFVLASGGGTPCYFNNIHLMNEKAKTIYLNVPVEELTNRLEFTEIGLRPMFKGKNIKSVLHELLSQRETIFKKANYQLNDSDINTDKIQRALEEEPHSK